jgi:hypothetical protein
MGANDNMLNLAGNIPTEMLAEQQQLTRQQQLANLLMQQGTQNLPTGSMVSGRFVPTSPFQYLAQFGNIAAGNYIGKKADEDAIKLAQKVRQQYANEAEQYQKIREGAPAQAGGIQAPSGEMTKETTADMYNADMSLNPQYKQVAPTAAIAPNPRAANIYGATVATNPVLQQFAQKEMFKGPDWKEVKQINKQTGETELWRYDANSQTPRDTFQFLGVEKAAFTPSEILHLNDQGIGTGQFGNPYGGGKSSVGGSYANSNLPNANVVSTGNVSGGSANVNAGNTVIANNPTKAPQIKNDDVVKEFGYNPFEAPKPPPNVVGGAAVRKFYSDQAAPLPAESQKTVRGAINYQKAVNTLQDEFAKYTDVDLAKPSVRANLKQKVTNAYLLGKESNSLGALTGPDLDLLEKLVYDPTSFDTLILDRKTINGLYDAQRKSAGDTIRESFRLAQKPVPMDMRNNIIVTPKVLPMSQSEIKKQLKAKNIPYDPSFDYQINPDGSVDRKKKK